MRKIPDTNRRMVILLLTVIGFGIYFARQEEYARKQRKIELIVSDMHGTLNYNSSRNALGLRRSRRSKFILDWIKWMNNHEFERSINSISINSSVKVPDELLVNLKSVSSLRKANFTGACINHDQFELLRELTQLSELRLQSMTITKEDLSNLMMFNNKNLESLYLDFTSLSNEDIKGLYGSPRLFRLSIRGTTIDDYGIELLKNLPALRVLNADMTNVQGKGFKGFSNLESLGLWGTKVDDEGLSTISAMLSLQRLGLSSTNITDIGMIHVGKLVGLKELTLDYTSISDEGIDRIGRLRDLERISISSTKITDSGLERIARFKSIKVVYAYRCNFITQGAVERIVRKYPYVMICK